ncbi:Qa-SNARE, Tlg2/Syntaxin16-family [Volvox carteri f. nagariensis]|uniref:Qa-SNARE, Tlg2/Syntaxin16-family n=1 Tax=Volvox carteri f. nagariensis TaxID=3068 RepID=D8TP16_VOLCA|nr:Qa-SNARE, Tlg2/Syntaxin16-family [Volvox carteri f. nagariensis]EFJ50543.1 Qa-SNARE, Tlg2/Syntaxin16-family [Volvox carteri f. nagariensis]|eukprot:XP_002948136.1 Qa-SNARE, Tlg2/Syntaxin16-family [Volvox carteri f. nagariensis]
MPPYGSTRNLTHQFIRLRNEARKLQGIGTVAQSDKATEKLISAALGNSSDVEAPGPSTSSSVAPVWVQQSERIRQELKVLKERIAKLREYHRKALLVTFDGENEAQVHAETLTREVQQSFKRLDAAIRIVGETTGPNDDAEIRKQVQQQLAQALFKLSLEFRREETRFLNKVEEHKGMEKGSSIGVIAEEEGTWTGGELMDPGFTQAQMAMVDISTNLVNERDTEIRKIVETIAELAQIMKDLATLVIEQGTMLDRIDQNVTQTAVKVEEGVKQLKAAETTQKRGRMFMCIIALICIIVLLLIIVIIRHA